MNSNTRNKILIAIAYLSLHGIKVNKSRIANYTQLSWQTVHKYYEDLYSHFMLTDIECFKSKYKGVKK